MIHLDTDAPLAVESGGVLAPGDARPLFDRLQVTVSPCSTNCTQLFLLDRSMLKDAMPTFGVYAIQAVSGSDVTLTLFREAGTIGGSYVPNASLGGSIKLPDLKPQSQPLDIYVQLLVANLGTTDPTTGVTRVLPFTTSPLPKLDTWSRAYPAPCSGAPGANEVCVPGGAFWMGNEQEPTESYQKLAVVSPFYLDATEVTVGQFRASGLATVDSKTGESSDPEDATFSGTPSCIYTSQSSGAGTDAEALDCVSWTQAQAYCQKQGKTLPSWLQFEYAAGGLSSQLYPWGQDEPQCGDAVYGRSAVTLAENAPDVASAACSESDTPQSPTVPKSGARDQVAVPGGGIVYDLGGNVTEWVVDYAPQTIPGPCTTENLLVDFVCSDMTAGFMGYRTQKGGSWAGLPFNLRASYTTYSDPTTSSDFTVGFRCARPGAP